MKKNLLFIFLLLLSASTASAFYFEDDYDGIQVGYRGFTDFSYTIGVHRSFDRVGIMTSHGYQFVPQLFAGVGVGFNYDYNGSNCGLPVFVHFRCDILDNEITPYADMRIGYSFLDIKGFYLNPSVGCRFELNEKLGVNVGIGYSLQMMDSPIRYNNEKKNRGGIDLRFGIDF